MHADLPTSVLETSQKPKIPPWTLNSKLLQSIIEGASGQALYRRWSFIDIMVQKKVKKISSRLPRSQYPLTRSSEFLVRICTSFLNRKSARAHELSMKINSIRNSRSVLFGDNFSTFSVASNNSWLWKDSVVKQWKLQKKSHVFPHMNWKCLRKNVWVFEELKWPPKINIGRW